jgi:PAS domain S-box-containing protein
MNAMKGTRRVGWTEDRSRQLLQSSGVALVVSHGVEQDVEIVNDRFTRLFGYTIEDMPDVSHWWPLAYPDETYRETVKAEWQRRVAKAVANQNEIEPMEAKVRCKDGSERYIEFHFSSMGDTNLVSFIDMTERKCAENALRESEERFRLMADTAPVLIWMSGIDKLCTYFNKPWLDFTGRSQEQELGNGWAEGVQSEDLQRCLQTYCQAFDERKKFRMEYRLRRHDGEYRWVLDIGVPRFNQDHSFAGYIGICVDVTDRKEAEQALQQANRISEEQAALLQTREELLKIFVKHVPAAVAMLDRDMRYLQVSDRWCADYSLDGPRILGRSHYEIFPDLPEGWKQIHRRCLEGETLRAEEDRWDRNGGTTWLRWEIRPWMNSDGLQGGILIFSEDITRRKQMEEALSGLSRKLIDAQEQERARIARELHDNINQRLAMLAVELEQLQDEPFDPTRVQELRRQTNEISDDVQALSHDLHSSKLQYLGVVAGIRSWCKEFGERQKMKINFTSDVSSLPIPSEIGICLFRVVQEAVHNSIKHSEASQIEVQLRTEFDEIHLTISDLGKGFDLEAASQGKGLGLTSMQERVRLVNGSIVIQSEPMSGTNIHVRVPFKFEQDAQRAG